METPNPNIATASCSESPVLDQEMTISVQPPMAELCLTEAEMRSDYVDPSFFSKKGVVIQFISNNCPGTTSMIGGIRLNLEDIRKVPAYLH